MLEDLQNKINYKFKNINYLKNAMTHSSYAFENNLNVNLSNERLEFLGDAVVELSISDYLYTTFSYLPEGKLTKLRAGLVCSQMLSALARDIDLGSCLMVGRGEELSNGRDRESTLADAFEAFIGAVYMDAGFETAKKIVFSIFEKEFEHLKSNPSIEGKTLDSKTSLQEKIQKNSKEPITYKIVQESGPAHDKIFVANVIHKNVVLGEGSGKSKKEAEQNAALNALKKFYI